MRQTPRFFAEPGGGHSIGGVGPSEESGMSLYSVRTPAATIQADINAASRPKGGGERVTGTDHAL